MNRLETTQASERPRRTFVVFRPRVEHFDIGARLEMPSGALVEVVDLWRGPAAEIPAMLVECALDPVCRTFSGAVTVMSSELGTRVGMGDVVSALVLNELGSQIQIAKSIPNGSKKP